MTGECLELGSDDTAMTRNCLPFDLIYRDGTTGSTSTTATSNSDLVLGNIERSREIASRAGGWPNFQ